MANPTAMKCIVDSKIGILDMLLAEINREDYQKAEDVKESINDYLAALHNKRKGLEDE